MRDNKNNIIAMLLVVCLIIMMMTILASADAKIGVSAKSAALYEPKTRTFSYSKDMNRRMPMASTTKIMTGLLAVELLDLDETVEVPKEAVGVEGSSIYLAEGDTLTIRDLVYSLLLQSANDAACAIAIKVAGDIRSFAEMMNERAYSIGLSDTSFKNPHGLDDEEHYTTAHDLALITAEALDNPTFKQIVSTYKYSFRCSGKTRTVVNHNKLLKSYDGSIGVKTGYTRHSGRCLVSAAVRDGVTLIAVTLSAPNDWQDHTELLDYGFTQFEAISPYSLVDGEYSIPVVSSETEHLCARLDDAGITSLVKRRDEPDITTNIQIRQFVIAPINIGDVVGEVEFLCGERVVAKMNIIATDNIAKDNKGFNIFDLFG